MLPLPLRKVPISAGLLKSLEGVGRNGPRLSYSSLPLTTSVSGSPACSFLRWKLRSLPSSSSSSCFVTLRKRFVHSDSSDGQEQKENQTQLNKRLPPLSQFPPLIWPKFTNSMRNWFFTYFVIKPYFDKEFVMQEFMDGALEAVAIVSSKLSKGEFDDLEGLVEPSLITELKEKVSNFSVSQQDLLRVATEDVFFSFPYQVGIIIPDSPDPSRFIESGMKPPPQTRHVEVTVVLHVLRGMAEIQRSQRTSNSNFSVIDFTKDEENKYRVMVCNYRFFRDFTEGCKDPSWIINMVNHFLPAEIQR